MHSLTFAGRGEYRLGMQSRTVISTPYPSVYTAAEELGVGERRAKRLASVMDAILSGMRVVSFKGVLVGRRRKTAKRRIARRMTKGRSRARRR